MPATRMRPYALIAAGLLLTGVAMAQGTGAPDLTFRRARQLADDGNATAGRALLDSVLAGVPEGSAPYVEALYWRATMAESRERARADYLRIAVEFSLSPHAEEALLRVAQMEFQRGDRVAAKKLLERLSLEHATGETRAQGLYWIGRVQLDEGAMAEACASLREARSRTATSDVELSNQIGYYARPCAAVERSADSVRADSAARADSLARADSAARADAAARKARAGSGSTAARSESRAERRDTGGTAWSVQVAAFAARDAAEQLVRRLGARGYSARVTAEKPYRVRIGRFSQREDALRLAEKLKAAQTDAIVVQAEKP